MREFEYKVDIIYDALTYLSDVNISEYFLDPYLCAKALRVGREKVKDIFGDGISIPPITCPHLAYGHLSCLGAQVIFPINSDPSIRPFVASIDEGIKKLSYETDFSLNSLFIHYINLYDYLKKEFPEHNISFSGFGWEGPLTTAVLMRGQDFFIDLYDEPVKVKEFLQLITDSIIRFNQFIRKINCQCKIDNEFGSLADDFAGLIPPKLWNDFVIPYWEQYFTGITTGKRILHAENLSPNHLKYLSLCRIDFYDPSVSQKLTPRVIKENTNVPFSWLLPTFKLVYMSKHDIEKWVYEAYENGAYAINTEISKFICENNNYMKIHELINVAQKLKNTVGIISV